VPVPKPVRWTRAQVRAPARAWILVVPGMLAQRQRMTQQAGPLALVALTAAPRVVALVALTAAPRVVALLAAWANNEPTTMGGAGLAPSIRSCSPLS
jgi:hypothetical protein